MQGVLFLGRLKLKIKNSNPNASGARVTQHLCLPRHHLSDYRNPVCYSERPMLEWIKCSDQLPEEYKPVLLCASHFPEDYARQDSLIFVGYLCAPYRDEMSWDCVWGDNWVPFQFKDITYWMPLPEVPK